MPAEGDVVDRSIWKQPPAERAGVDARPEVAMKPALLDILACPRCVESLDLRTDAGDGIEVHEGTLRCPRLRPQLPRSPAGFRGSWRAAPYAASFGWQWHWFRRVQLDSQSGSTESARTLEGHDGRGRRRTTAVAWCWMPVSARGASPRSSRTRAARWSAWI